jgi:lambda family phage tail tape measure protein
MEIFENTEKANKEYLAKMPAQMKAERESDINQQLAALDLAEKLGTAHRDTLDERIRLTLELLRVQEAYLASLDPEKDAGAIISQREALSKTRQALADISRDLELRNPISAIDLGLKEVSNTAADTGRQMRDATTKAFDGMSDALTEYAVTGKATFKDLADAIVRDLMRIQIRAAMAGITGGSGLGGMLSNLFGSSPSPGTFDSGVGDWAATFSASHHAGGAVGSRGPYRLVINPDLLPRKHSGGMAPNERMVINKVGERYVTEEQNDWLTSIAKSASRGGSAPDENHIHVHMSVNALDSQSVSQSLAKHQSEIVGMVQYAYNRIGQRGPLGR